MAAIIRQQPIRVGSGAGEVGSTAPVTDEPKFCACANFKKFYKNLFSDKFHQNLFNNKFLFLLTFVAALQCITLVATTLLINETLSDLDKTSTPFSRPMTSMTMGVSRPGKWSSMFGDKAIRAVPVRRLEGPSEAEMEIREVFK